MFFKNLKYAFRNLRRDKFYTFLNGFGLTIGMAVALMISMWIQDELSYDNYHSENGSNFLVLSNFTFGGESSTGVRTPFPLGPSAKEQIPEIEFAARATELWKPVLKYENTLIEVEDGHLVEPNFFKILDFKFLQGNPENVLSIPNSIVLTESKAKEIFKIENAIGKTLKLDDQIDLRVTGIIEDTPVNTHLPVDFFIPFEKNINLYLSERNRQWQSLNLSTYFSLKPEADIASIENKLTALIPKGGDSSISFSNEFKLHPVRNIYMGLPTGVRGFPKGDWSTIRMFGWIGMIILLIASINYINLTTARSAHRAKAAGIKKIVGASRFQLMSQHILEAVVLVGVCSMAALLVVQFGMPYFEEISGKEFTSKTVFSQRTFLPLGGVAFVTVLLSGIHPSIQLSAFQPVEVLKGSQFKGVAGKGGLRKILVVLQFVASAALIICTIFMLRQMDFIQGAKLGYEKEYVFSFRQEHENSPLVAHALKGQSGISDVAQSSQSIINTNNKTQIANWEGKSDDKEFPIVYNYVDDNFKDFFQLELKTGRWFFPEKLDSFSVILNETAVKEMGLENPEGKWIDLWGSKGTIVGVVKDFHFQSFHNEIQPLVFLQSSNWFPVTYIKTSGTNVSQAVASTENIFKEYFPNSVFKYSFLDESHSRLYDKEKRAGSLFFFFAFIAIIISCLGIFGLATYTAERRFKEISIRKVLGASVFSIVELLSKDFLKLVFIALILAIPIAWYFIEDWLNNFVFRIDLDWWVFALAGLLAVGVAFLTVSLQSVKAALSNPVESLKND